MVILGAKGLAKELLQVLHCNGINDLMFFDNINQDISDNLYGFKILKSWEELQKVFKTNPNFALGIGGTKTRQKLACMAIEYGGKLCTIVSNRADVGHYGNTIGDGVCILSQAQITIDTVVGEGSLINKQVIISHDARVGKYCEISPGARILGRTKIGNYTEIGTNAVILPDVIVGSNCKIGAGSVVTKNVPDNTTVVGIPAKELVKQFA